MPRDVHEDTLKIARETMTGDLRDCVLDFMKHEKNPLPWNMQTEEAQRDAIAKVTAACNRAVERAVAMIAADGRQTIAAQLEQVVVKDGIKAVVTLARSDALRHALIDATGQAVLIVVSDAAEYRGESKPALPEPNQPDLPVFDQTDASRE